MADNKLTKKKEFVIPFSTFPLVASDAKLKIMCSKYEVFKHKLLRGTTFSILEGDRTNKFFMGQMMLHAYFSVHSKKKFFFVPIHVYISRNERIPLKDFLLGSETEHDFLVDYVNLKIDKKDVAYTKKNFLGCHVTKVRDIHGLVAKFEMKFDGMNMYNTDVRSVHFSFKIPEKDDFKWIINSIDMSLKVHGL
jgi:hypothetical protein